MVPTMLHIKTYVNERSPLVIRYPAGISVISLGIGINVPSTRVMIKMPR